MTSKHNIAIIEDNKVIRENVSTYIGLHDEFNFNASFGNIEDFLSYMDKDKTFTTDIMLLGHFFISKGQIK